jgi:hypothetical protein
MSGSVEDDLQEVKQRLVDSKQMIPAVDDLRQFLKLVRAEVFRCSQAAIVSCNVNVSAWESRKCGHKSAKVPNSRSAQQLWLQRLF